MDFSFWGINLLNKNTFITDKYLIFFFLSFFHGTHTHMPSRENRDVSGSLAILNTCYLVNNWREEIQTLKCAYDNPFNCNTLTRIYVLSRIIWISVTIFMVREERWESTLSSVNISLTAHWCPRRSVPSVDEWECYGDYRSTDSIETNRLA